ncbi:hypothetical protein AAEZ42_11260 [Limosilactobacillus fermentum]
MNDYWLVLFDQEPRRFRVIENLLKNRLSEATMFWAMVYGIQEAVAGQRQLKRAEFDKWMNQQVTAGLMVQEEGQAWLTTAGLVEKQRLLTEHYQPRFGNWGGELTRNAWPTGSYWGFKWFPSLPTIIVATVP